VACLVEGFKISVTPLPAWSSLFIMMRRWYCSIVPKLFLISSRVRKRKWAGWQS